MTVTLGGDGPNKLPQGENNKFIEKVRYKFGMSGYNTAFLRFSAENTTEPNWWDIPDYITPKGWQSDNMRLEMLGFQFQDSPFAFSYTDVGD